MLTESLKKQLKSIDLCLNAARRRVSPRTGFVHHFSGDESYSDTIPIYENFCFVLALYRQKTIDSAMEGKELLEKLLAFQTSDGSFPVYLHEFPQSRNWMQGLKIAPLLIQLQRKFSSVLPSDLKKKLSLSVESILDFSKDKVSGPWKFRYRMCKEGGVLEGPDSQTFSSSDWAEWLISAQLGDEEILFPSHLFHPGLQAFIGPIATDVQEKFEPRPSPIEWLLADLEDHFSERLLKDHPLQLQLSAFWPLEKNSEATIAEERAITCQKAGPGVSQILRILWGKDRLHSFTLPQMRAKITVLDEGTFLFDLPPDADQSRNDLFEVALYCDASLENSLTINGKRGTVFSLGDQVEITSLGQQISIRFEAVLGTGDYRGHLSKANRPTQGPVKHNEAYDWQIGLRTLRRSSEAQIKVTLKIT